MAVLVPAIYVFLKGCKAKQDVDARHKAGHDENQATDARGITGIETIRLFALYLARKIGHRKRAGPLRQAQRCWEYRGVTVTSFSA